MEQDGRREKGAPRRGTSSRRRQENISAIVRKEAGAGGRAGRRGSGPPIRDEGVGVIVLRLDGPPPAFFVFPVPPTPAAQGDDPEKFKELAMQMMVLSASPRNGVPDA